MEMWLNAVLAVSQEPTLEIKFLEILLHVLNLIVLIAFLRILLYKPTVSFINNRRKRLEEIAEENKQLIAETERVKASSEEILTKARQNAEFISLEATKAAEGKSRAILSEAKERSDALVLRTRKDIENEKMRIEQEIKQQVVELAVELAGKVLEREVSLDDNEKIIDSCLESWSKSGKEV